MGKRCKRLLGSYSGGEENFELFTRDLVRREKMNVCVDCDNNLLSSSQGTTGIGQTTLPDSNTSCIRKGKRTTQLKIPKQLLKD